MEGDYQENIKCPICLEIPPKEIFQCNNGHTICNDCCKTLLKCPECRVKYESKKIRNRALEGLLDKMKFDCDYKSQGCPEKKRRQDFLSHSKNCIFGVNLRFCEHLGYSCQFRINVNNLRDTIAHLVDNHAFLLCENVQDLQITLEDFTNIDFKKSTYWTPVILGFEELQRAIVFVCMYNKSDQTISLICIRIPTKSGSSESEGLTMTFGIKSVDSNKNPDMEWATKPVDVKFSENILREPHVRLSRQLLINQFVKDGILTVHCSLDNGNIQHEARFVDVISLLNVGIDFVGHTSSPSNLQATTSHSQKESPYKPFRQNRNTCFENLSCKNCSVGPIRRLIFKCLECVDYNLCEPCMVNEAHKQHTFAVVRDKEQEQEMARKLHSLVKLQVKPGTPEATIEVKLQKDRAQINRILYSREMDMYRCIGCRGLPRFMCLKCEPNVWYCEACFNLFGFNHDVKHVFAVVKSFEVHLKLMEFMFQCRNI